MNRNCDEDFLTETLLDHHLDPTIRDNKELVDELTWLYGDELPFLFKEENIFLDKDKNSRVDAKTITWAQEKIKERDSKITRYFPILVGVNNYGDMESLVSIIYLSTILRERHTILVFIDLNEYTSFKSFAEKNIRNIIEKLEPGLSESELIEDVELFQQLYLDARTYISFGFDNINNKAPIIVLEAHGGAYINGLTFDINVGFIINSEKIVERLMLLGLPENSTIKLKSCFSGCSKSKSKYSIQEIKNIIMRGKPNLLVGNVEKTFFDMFSTALLTSFDSFNGKIQAYVGAGYFIKQDNVFTKTGAILPEASAVTITAKDGQKIDVKSQDARLELSVADL